MMIAAVPPTTRLARSPLISHEMLPGPPPMPGVAGLAAVDLGLVVAPAGGLDLGHDRFPKVEHAPLYSGVR